MPFELPPEALRRLRQIELAADTAQQGANYAVARIGDIDRALGNDPSKRDQLADEREELIASRISHQTRYKALAGLLGHIRPWLQQMQMEPRPVTLAPLVIPKRKRGETYAAAIDRLRLEITEIKKKQAVVFSAPIPRETLKERAAALVSSISTSMSPALGVADGRIQIDFKLAALFGDVTGGLTPNHVFAMMCWLAPAQMVARLSQQVDDMNYPTSTMDEGLRKQKLRELHVELLDLEIEEEALVRDAHQEGIVSITRRPDASPLVVLGLTWAKSSGPKANGHAITASRPASPDDVAAETSKRERVRLKDKAQDVSAS